MTAPPGAGGRPARPGEAVLRLRHALLRGLRAHFDERGYLETDAPLLTPFPTLDANISPIPAEVRDWHGRRRVMYLHTSPEYSMKKLLADGIERLYFLGKAFRNGEITERHNPEFTLLEWYTAGAGLDDLLRQTEALVRDAAMRLTGSLRITVRGRGLDLGGPWKRITVSELFRRETGEDLDPEGSAADLAAIAARIRVHAETTDDWETVFSRIYLERMEPGLGSDSPVFLTEYPARLGMNARRKPGDSRWAERAELYIGGLELANGYAEIADAGEQASRFESDRVRKKAETGEAPPVDTELIEAMRKGFPACAGNALGVDRLLMLFADAPAIRDVLAFPMERWM